MATTTLANRAVKPQNIFKLLSYNKFFSTTTNVSSSSASAKPKKKKNNKKNLFEVAQFLPNYGLGYHMAKTHWSNVSYQITKLNLYKDGRHGKAWGIVHKDGLQAADAPKKISGVHKRCWRYLPNLPKATEGMSSTTKAIEKPSIAEAQPA